MDRTAAQDELAGWIGFQHRRLVLPSWVLSALIHAALMAIFLWLSQSRGCQPDYSGEEGDGFRTVGIYLTSGESEEETPEQPVQESASPPVEAVTPLNQSPLVEGPPIDIERPAAFTSSVIGLGSPPELSGGIKVPSPA